MNTRANSTSARDIAYHVHGYTNLKKHEDIGPHIIESGAGIRVTDDNGNSFIEGLAGLWCTSLGFSEQRLIDAAMSAFQRLPYYHGFGGRTTDMTIELAERLVKMAPVPMSKALFANSGSEATDLSLKLVWYYHNAIGKPEKKKIISRIKGYHGVTVASASLTGLPHLHAEFDLPIDRIMHTSCPHHYRFGQEGENEEDFATRCAMDLENLIEREGADTIAAFYAEPVMGAGGVLVPPKTYFKKIQKVLKKYNILLIADEVICGFGRTGNMWGSTTFEMKPDMITMAKALSSAYLPISALLINEKIYQAMVGQSDKLGLFGHGGTYAGHPVSAAVALETLNIYEERNIVSHVQKMTPQLQAGLRSFSDHPLVGEVRGVGLIAGVEIIKDKKTKKSFDPKLAVGSKCQSFTLENGLIIRAVGDTLAFCPPLIINEVEIAELIASFSKGLDQTWTWVKEEGFYV
jgi:4-aminobutyrate--pyruvate transaminase